MEIKFTIRGNQNEPKGNPIPYTRVVGRALWTVEAKRYAAWKEYVRAEYIEKSKSPITAKVGEELLYLMTFDTKVSPIVLNSGHKARMELKIFWANESHGDPDNIFKGIADALFANDKQLAGSFDFEKAKDGKGKVEVRITIE